MSVDTETVELVGDELVGNVARAAVFAALIGGCAYVSFPNPLSPVPVTLQVLALFLAGIYLGPLWGSASMTLYLVAGAAGAPIFSGGAAGVGMLFGPTGGYLWSYPVAALAIGFVVHRGFDLRNPETASTPLLVGAMLVGTVIVYALGSVGFALVQQTTLMNAVTTAAAPFVPFEAIKIAAAVGIVRSEAIAAA